MTCAKRTSRTESSARPGARTSTHQPPPSSASRPRRRRTHEQQHNSTAAASSVQRTQQRRDPLTSTRSTSSAHIRDDGQPEGEVTRPHDPARPPRVLRSAKSCKFENWINHFRSLLGCDGVPESCGIVACGFRTRHGGTVTAQGCRTAGRSDLSRTAGSLQSELTSWPHPYSQDRSSTHVPHEPASSDLSLKSRQSSDSCGDGEIRTPEGLPPQPP